MDRERKAQIVNQLVGTVSKLEGSSESDHKLMKGRDKMNQKSAIYLSSKSNDKKEQHGCFRRASPYSSIRLKLSTIEPNSFPTIKSGEIEFNKNRGIKEGLNEEKSIDKQSKSCSN